MSTSLAARLSDLRRAHGMSQDNVAEHLGIARQSVSKWERGEITPDSDNLIALAQLYNTSLDDLLVSPLRPRRRRNLTRTTPIVRAPSCSLHASSLLCS